MRCPGPDKAKEQEATDRQHVWKRETRRGTSTRIFAFSSGLLRSCCSLGGRKLLTWLPLSTTTPFWFWHVSTHVAIPPFLLIHITRSKTRKLRHGVTTKLRCCHHHGRLRRGVRGFVVEQFCSPKGDGLRAHSVKTVRPICKSWTVRADAMQTTKVNTTWSVQWPSGRRKPRKWEPSSALSKERKEPRCRHNAFQILELRGTCVHLARLWQGLWKTISRRLAIVRCYRNRLESHGSAGELECNLGLDGYLELNRPVKLGVVKLR